ncbi:MAG TPA: energy transducer TonB [Salinivirga sp.]|uniref:energy transducer TonB n=1 Tax=Salinivirga sp. TaxID=1970192 RepID=UPI002B489890|nr:energy transducer TonB [Salinivirga sp.]HKK60774.1 energy transducer TonB [Salinivirga sp.]
MEVKKNPNVSLEKGRGMLMLAGLVTVLGLLLVAFNWNSSSGTAEDLGQVMEVNMEEEMIQTQRQEKVEPPPPPPKKKVIEELTVVDNEEELDDELDIDTEADEETMIEQTDIMIEEEVEEEEPEIFMVVEQMPEFPGGQGELFKYISQNIQYPAIAKENGIQGKVFIQFVVGKDGSITNVTVLRGVDPSLDKEAVRVVKNMPKWKPGKQRGKPVYVRYQVPINFKLQ